MKILFPLLMAILLSGCNPFEDNRVPSTQSAPVYIDEVCLTFFGLDKEQVLEIGDLPGIPTGETVTIETDYVGIQFWCFDWDYTSQKRLSEPERKYPSSRLPRYSMSANSWSKLQGHLHIWLKENFDAAVEFFNVPDNIRRLF